MSPPAERPLVTIVFLVFNRRDELRTSLTQMTRASDYPAERVEVIVVDNASSDGSAAMVRAEFPDVTVIERDVNVGVSGWNDGFRAARGEFVLALDDDCYLPPDGLSRAVAAAEAARADLVSFGVTSSFDPTHRFEREDYRTGLFTFWGCAVLIRRAALDRLGGYDPRIFVWANELEFTLRFFDSGFRHLHLPDVVAVHIKEPGEHWTGYPPSRAYRVNARHFSYIAAKLFSPGDALESLVAVVTTCVRDALSVDRAAIRAVAAALRGFADGLRHRAPLRNAAISHFYRRNFETFASPWWISRPPLALLQALPAELRRALRPGGGGAPQPPNDRFDRYHARRAHLYPNEAATLEFGADGSATVSSPRDLVG